MLISERAKRVRTMLETVAVEAPHLKAGLYEDTWGDNRTWMIGRVRDTNEIGLGVRTWTQKYLTAMSLGPWRIQGQVRQKNLILSAVGDAEFSSLTATAVVSLPFRLRWQTEQTVEFHRNLRASGGTIDELCTRLQRSSGDGAYRILADMSGVKSCSKCLDFFIREGLCLDRVPVDRHVGRILARFGLSHVPRSELPRLIREAGFNPRFVARVLYDQGVLVPPNSPLQRPGCAGR